MSALSNNSATDSLLAAEPADVESGDRAPRSAASAAHSPRNSYKPAAVVPSAKSSGWSSHSFSRDEMNLAEFPLTVLSTRVDQKVKTLEFTDHVRLKNGELAERKWIITGADKFGLPTSTDDDVILGLIRLSMDHGFRQRKVYFSRYELLKALRWSTEGRSYSRLTKSLDRLSGVRIRAANSFYDNSSKSYQTCNFGIIDAYEINDHRGKKGEDAPKSFFIWSEMLFDSFKSGFIKKLDLDMYFSLKSSVSRRLYRYLDKNFYFRSVIEKPLMELAFEKIGLSRTYKYVSSIKQQIEPAADELVRLGFLASYECLGKGPQTIIRFVSNQSATSPTVVGGIGGSSSAQNAPGARTTRLGDASPPSRYAEQRPLGPQMVEGRTGALGRSANLTGERARPLEGSFDGGGFEGGSYDGAEGSYARGSNHPLLHGRGGSGEGSVPSVSSSPRGATGALSAAHASTANELVEALVSRGIGVKQAMRLIERRLPDEYRALDRIIRYYDTLVEANDPKVSKNKVGFLYRAVESPHRFTIPSSFQKQNELPFEAKSTDAKRSSRSAAGEERESPNPRTRRDPVQAQAKSAQEERALQAYRAFTDRALTEGLERLEPQTVPQLVQSVEKKLSMLKEFLSEQRFREAVDGCVRDELLKLLAVPDFSSWRRESGA